MKSRMELLFLVNYGGGEKVFLIWNKCAWKRK